MYDPQIQTHPLLWSRACMYQIWWKSYEPNWSYRANKGANKPFLQPYCTEKILEKSEKYVRPPNSNSSFIKG